MSLSGWRTEKALVSRESARPHHSRHGGADDIREFTARERHLPESLTLHRVRGDRILQGSSRWLQMRALVSPANTPRKLASPGATRQPHQPHP